MTRHAARLSVPMGRAAAALLVVALLAGCDGSAATAPANTLALSPAPVTSSSPGTSPTASPSPSPDPIVHAAEAYLALATTLNAKTAAVGTIAPTATLAEVKAFYTSLAAIQAEGVAGIQAITFPTRLKDAVENLIRATNAVRTAEASIASAASLAQVSSRSASLASAFESMGQAANNLRQRLGLQPVTAAAPPPTLRPIPSPTPGPTAIPSIDPTANLRVASPYSLEAMDAASLSQLHAQLEASLGALAPAFQIGGRWVNQGKEHVALVIIMEVPGFGSTITAPATLDQMAAGIAGTSTGGVQTTTILGQPVRLAEKLGSPIALYVQGEGVAIVIGLTGMQMDSLKTVVEALIRAR